MCRREAWAAYRYSRWTKRDRRALDAAQAVRDLCAGHNWKPPTNIMAFVQRWHTFGEEEGRLTRNWGSGRPAWWHNDAAREQLQACLDELRAGDPATQLPWTAGYRSPQCLKLKAAFPNVTNKKLTAAFRALDKSLVLKTPKVRKGITPAAKAERLRVATDRLQAFANTDIGRYFIFDETSIWFGQLVKKPPQLVMFKGTALYEQYKKPIESSRVPYGSKDDHKVCLLAGLNALVGAGPIIALTGTKGIVSQYVVSGVCARVKKGALAALCA
jgi:hypothetical protein